MLVLLAGVSFGGCELFQFISPKRVRLAPAILGSAKIRTYAMNDGSSPNREGESGRKQVEDLKVAIIAWNTVFLDNRYRNLVNCPLQYH
jgi:hypothetical protein